MERLIINVDNSSNAALLIRLVKRLSFVTSVSREKNVTIPLTPNSSDWIMPGRPATDEEIEQLCIEMDAEETEGKYFTLEESKAKTLKSLERWKKKNQK